MKYFILLVITISALVIGSWFSSPQRRIVETKIVGLGHLHYLDRNGDLVGYQTFTMPKPVFASECPLGHS